MRTFHFREKGLNDMWISKTDSDRTIQQNIGKTIKSVYLYEGEYITKLCFNFTDGSKMALYDNGQNCCEDRYMTCDDDLSVHQNAKLVSIEVCDTEYAETELGNYHEIQFLVIDTTRGAITVETHNEHNGYYGGFDVIAIQE